MNRPSDPITVSETIVDDREPEGALALKVRGLNLRAGSRQLLNNVSFDIKAGEFVAIVGEVGSGKSLLVLSLAGETAATFETFEMLRGSKTIDASKLPLDERRRKFAYVGQDGFVMSASLRENVMFKYGGTAADDQEVLNSLALAQFRIDGEHLQNGLETEIGERGVNLSGGQRQRVALARAHFLRRPVFLLDDCLSAVDVDTERRLISELIDGAWENRTRLLITHRLSVLEKVDRVIFIEDGAIVASGPFEDLLQTSQKVRDFVASVRRGDAHAKPAGEKTEEAQVATEGAESVVAAVTDSSVQEVPDGQS